MMPNVPRMMPNVPRTMQELEVKSIGVLAAMFPE
jgi:hypothetical protein